MHFLRAPVYLFDSCELLDHVYPPSLAAMAPAVAGVASTGGQRAAAVRAGSPPPAPPCA